MISIQSLEKNRKGNLKGTHFPPFHILIEEICSAPLKQKILPGFSTQNESAPGIALGSQRVVIGCWHKEKGLWRFHNNYMMQQLCPPLWIAPPQRLWERDRFELSVCFSRGRSMHVLFLSFSLVGRPKLDLCDSLTFCAGEMARIPPNKPSKHRRNPEEGATTIQVR